MLARTGAGTGVVLPAAAPAPIPPEAAPAPLIPGTYTSAWEEHHAVKGGGEQEGGARATRGNLGDPAKACCWDPSCPRQSAQKKVYPNRLRVSEGGGRGLVSCGTAPSPSIVPGGTASDRAPGPTTVDKSGAASSFLESSTQGDRSSRCKAASRTSLSTTSTLDTWARGQGVKSGNREEVRRVSDTAQTSGALYLGCVTARGAQQGDSGAIRGGGWWAGG